MKRCKFCKGVRRFIRSQYEKYLKDMSEAKAKEIAATIRHEYPGETLEYIAKRVKTGNF